MVFIFFNDFENWVFYIVKWCQIIFNFFNIKIFYGIYKNVIHCFCNFFIHQIQFVDFRREAESNLSLPNSVIAHHHNNLRTNDEYDLEHVINTDSSLETCPFATFSVGLYFNFKVT